MKVKVLGLVALAALLTGISLAMSPSPSDEPPLSEGALSLEISVPDDPRIRATGIAYTVEGASTFSGTLDGVEQALYRSTLSPVLAGRDYVVRVHTLATTGYEPCSGSAEFDVAPGQNTSVSVKVRCAPAVAAAEVALQRASDAANQCPRIDSVVASPARGERQMLLSAHATDPDLSPSDLQFQWSAADIPVADATEAAASIDCRKPGTYRISLTVSDGACSDSLVQAVTCLDPIVAVAHGENAATGSRDPKLGITGSPSSAAARPIAIIGAATETSAHVSTSASARASASTTSSPSSARGSSSSSPSSSRQGEGTSSTTNTSVTSTTGTLKRSGEPRMDSCAQCESVVHDDNPNCPDSKAACDSLPGFTSPNSPIMPGAPKALLCRQIVDCMHATRCASPTSTGPSMPTDCFCGANVPPHDCFVLGTYGTASGTCKELIAAGSESIEIGDIAMHFFNPTFAAGAAENVVETCDANFCVKECL